MMWSELLSGCMIGCMISILFDWGCRIVAVGMMVDVELEIDAGVVQGVIDSNVVVCIRDRSRLRNLLAKSPGFGRMDGRSRRLD